mmetsp:Transcript_30138/g.71801  ORF Transcript_30138/g.71801 Transcript_30138/m.71801 type:complete len:216 (-) Transcript_30138:247-894(-)
MDSVPEVFRHLGIFHECLKRTNFPNDVAIAVDINWHEGLMPASDQCRHGNRRIPLKAITRIQQESRDFPHCPVSGCHRSLPAPGVLLAGVSARILRRARFFILRLEHCQSLSSSAFEKIGSTRAILCKNWQDSAVKPMSTFLKPLLKLRRAGHVAKCQLKSFCCAGTNHQKVQIQLLLVWGWPPVLRYGIFVCEFNSTMQQANLTVWNLSQLRAF